MNLTIYPVDSRIAGRYQVASRPLTGGMGIVYLCYDHSENRPVVIKTFRPEFLPDRAMRDRFLREGDTSIKLGRHPHIVEAYRVTRPGNGSEVFLVLELVAKAQGRQDASLRSWLAPGQPLPPAQAMLFAMQVFRGMQHATNRLPGFVHRDLKPENLLVGSDKLTNADIHRLRVTDLGLASVLGDLRDAGSVDEHDTSAFGRTQLTHGIVGTPLYVAPEQWRGEAVSTATDIYALGCIVFELLAGERLVTGGTLSQLQAAHCQPRRKAFPAGVPVPLRQWVERCAAVSPAKRYPSWAEAEQGQREAYTAVTGQSLPEPEAAQHLRRTEHVAAGWAQSAMGASYLDLGKAAVAVSYFDRAAEVGKRKGETRLEGAGLAHLGVAYARLGDARRAIGFFEQALAIAREIGDLQGEAIDSFNTVNLYRAQGGTAKALPLAQHASSLFRQMESPYSQNAEQLIAALQGRAPAGGGVNETAIRQQFGQLIEVVIAGAHGNKQARAAVEQVFPQLAQAGFQIVEPIKQIWKGERNENKLTRGLDATDSFILREILAQLK